MYPKPIKPTFLEDERGKDEDEEARARKVCLCRWWSWRREREGKVGEGVRKAKAVVSWRTSMVLKMTSREMGEKDNGGICL